MSWAILTISLVIAGVAFLLLTVRSIGRARSESEHYRLSILFWASLAGLGLTLVALFAHPVLNNEWLRSETGVVSTALMSILPVVVIVAGLRNALTLGAAHRRRRVALRDGIAVTGRVVQRRRKLLGQDLMSVVVEADLPDPRPRNDVAYRQKDPSPTIRHRFIETCPGDHWRRFEPGCEVTLKVDPGALDRFAVLLFEPAR